MEEEQEPQPKQPCKTCGPTGWNPQQTRRELFKNAAIAGVGIATTATFLTMPTPAYAADFDIGACLGAADDAYDACMAAANALPDDSVWDGIKRTRARAKCAVKKATDVAKCYDQLAKELAKAVKDYIAKHPYLVAGAIVVLLGVVLVVVIIAAAPVLILA